MGWKGYESRISLEMLFRKMYCHKCGARLKIKKVTKIYNKGDSEYSDMILGHGTIGMDKKEVSHYVYLCPICHLETTYDEQREINKTK